MAAASLSGLVKTLSLNEEDLKTNVSQVEIITQEQMSKLFSGVPSIYLDEFAVHESNLKNCLLTSKLSSGIALFAVSLVDGKPTRYGLFRHLMDDNALVQFINDMHRRAHSVNLYLFVGLGDHNDIITLIKKTKGTIVYELINPWNVKIDKYMENPNFYDENYQFGMTVGMTPEGKIYVADETNGAKAGSFVTDHPAS